MLIKSFSRHFAVRVLVIIIIQLGFIWAKLAGLLAWHWLLIFAPLLFIGFVLAVFFFIGMVFLILSDERR